METSRYVWHGDEDDLIVMSKIIDRDDPDYRDDLEKIPAQDLAEITEGYPNLGALAWEEGCF